MKVAQQLSILSDEIKKLLLTGKNYTIFIDVKRSQVIYFKYVENNSLVKINLKKEYANDQQSRTGPEDSGQGVT